MKGFKSTYLCNLELLTLHFYFTVGTVTYKPVSGLT